MKRLLIRPFSGQVRVVVCGTLLASMGVGCTLLNAVTPRDACKAALDEQRARVNGYVQEKRFGQPLPRLEGAALDKFISRDFSAADQDMIRKSVSGEFERLKKDVVFPAWVNFRMDAISADVDKLVAEGDASAKTNGFALARAKFEAAREVCWRERVVNVGFGETFVPEVYDPVHKETTRLLNGKIGVTEWQHVENEMNLIATNAILTARLEDGIAQLKAYKPIRAYTRILDGKVEALVAELNRLNIPKAATDRIVKLTVKWMREYENLKDETDVLGQPKTRLVGAGEKIDKSKYLRLKKEYEESLRLYNCTDKRTRQIIDDLAKAVEKLFNLYVQEPDPGHMETTQTLALLGATALNNRIAKHQAVLVKLLQSDLDNSKKLGAEVDEFLRGDPMKALAKVGAILTGVEKADMAARALALRKLQTEINPALLEKFRKEITAKMDEFARQGKCAEGIAWLDANYPPIRTYSEEIDQSFAQVKAAAVAFGVPEAEAAKIMQDVARTAAEMANLADYTGEIRNEPTPGTKIPREKLLKFNNAVQASRSTLIRKGCTEANANELAKMMMDLFSKKQEALEADIPRKVYYLGSNKLNALLKQLKIRSAGRLIGRCVSDLVDQKRFAEARSLIRDIALTGNDEFDAEVYAMRIGVLNTVVNPVQFEVCKSEIAAKIEELWKKGDCRGVRDWMAAYPYVHDTYPDLIKAGKAIQTAMENLKVENPDPELYLARVLAKVTETIESAKSAYTLPARKEDMTELERALNLFEHAYVAQYYNKDAVQATREDIRKSVLAFLKKEIVSMSTSGVNAALRKFMEAEVRRHVAADVKARQPRYRLADDPVSADLVKEMVLKMAHDGFIAYNAGKEKPEEVYAAMAGSASMTALEWLRKLWDELNAPKSETSAQDAAELDFAKLMDFLVKRQEYLELLAAMDKQVAYDSQIAMAEDAIAKQLCVPEPETHLKVNAVLGEYARAMRLLKQAKTLNKDQGAALVVGSVYLDQPAVFDRALELGADVNAVSPRDPLKRSALLLAIQLGRTVFVHRLVAAGADVQVVDANKDTAVHYAVRRGSLALLEAMLAKNDVNAQNAKGETALFDAARNNEPALVKALAVASADVMKANAERQTAFDAACIAGSRDVLEELAAAGVEFGSAQLALAAKNNRLGVAQWLVSKGVDVNASGVMEASKHSPAVRAFLLKQGGVVSR